MLRLGNQLGALSTVAGMLMAFGPAWSAQASPLAVNETFSSFGTIGTQGITGAPVVSFQGVDAGSLTTGTPFTLGQFVVGAQAPGTSTTYLNTPFEIVFNQSVNVGPGQPPVSHSTVLGGWLTGTVSGGSPNGLFAGFDQVLFPAEIPGGLPFNTFVFPFQTGTYMNYIQITKTPAQGNLLTVDALLNVTQTVPEPSSVFSFVVLVGLVAWARRKGE